MYTCTFAWIALCDPNWISAVGSMLGGLGTLAAVWVALQWRRQGRHTKKAEVAGEALSAAFAALDGLELVSSPALPAQPGEYSDKGWFKEVLNSRWSTIAEDMRRVRAAHGLAMVHLDEKCQAVLSEIQKLQRDIHTSQNMWFELYFSDAKPSAAEFYDRALGPKVAEKIEALRVQVKARLGPVARMD